MASIKFLSILALFLFILAGSYFISERGFAAHRVDDYQRELQISSRLLRQYIHVCDDQQYNNFMPYVAHAITAYERKIEKLKGAPFFFGSEFIDQHYEFADKYNSGLESANTDIQDCGQT